MIFIQDGYGPSDKINKALSGDLASGVILNAKTRHPKNIKADILELAKHKGKEILFDPQFYVSRINAEKYGHLTGHPYFKRNLKPKDFGPKKLPGIVQDTIKYQIEIGLQNIISPALFMTSFDGQDLLVNEWLAEESIELAKKINPKGKIYLSLPLHESALEQEKPMLNFLDDATIKDADGYYIVVERLAGTDPYWNDPRKLAHLMYIVNSLHDNDFEVVVGYTDIYGILLSAVGATAVASGWYKNQRIFTKNQYYKSGGGPSKDRYASKQLLNLVLTAEELQPIFDLGFIEQVIMKTTYDGKMLSGPITQSWSLEEDVFQFWSVMNSLLGEIDKETDLEKRLNKVEKLIAHAESLYTLYTQKDIIFSLETGPRHLSVWREAIALFKNEFS